MFLLVLLIGRKFPFVTLGWYDVIVLPANECKWIFKEGDVAVLSAPRPGSGMILE